MVRPWYCHRIHGDIQRHENIDGTTVYAIRETPCDCVPPPLPPSLHTQQQQQQWQQPVMAMPDITVVPPVSAEPLQLANVNPPPPLPPLSDSVAAPDVNTNTTTTTLGPYGCTVADHEIYQMCGFAFCPKCGIHTVPGGRTVDPVSCPLPHRRAEARPSHAGEGDGGEGHRFCYLCGSSIAEPATPPPAPAPAPAPATGAAPSATPPAGTVYLGVGEPVQSHGITALGAGEPSPPSAPAPPSATHPPHPPTEDDINERGAVPIGEGNNGSAGGGAASLPVPTPSTCVPAPAAAHPSGLISEEDKAVIDAVLDRLIWRTEANGNAVQVPCGLPGCFLCQRLPQQQQQQSCGNTVAPPRGGASTNGAWTGNAAVTIIHNHYHT